MSIFKEFSFNFKTPFFSYDLSNNNFTEVKLISYEIEELPASDLQFVRSNNITIDSVVTLSLSSSFDDNKVHKYLIGTPIVLKNDVYYRVKSFYFKELNSKEPRSLNLLKVIPPKESVLNDSESLWFKFSVINSGFYKITFEQLESLGFNPKKEGFEYFHIYGNSTGVLPELNSSYRDVDLLQNNVFYLGGEDGSFDKSDAIVFYSPGPNILNYDKVDSLFTRKLNIYSDYSTYFLRGTNKVKSKIINKVYHNDVKNVLQSDELDVCDVHEVEDTSLVFAGKRWYGEVFDVNKKFDFSFSKFSSSLNDLVVSISGASSARVSGSKINVYLDGTYIGFIDLGYISTEYLRIEKSFKFSSHKGFSVVSLELVKSSIDSKFFLDKIEINARIKSTANYNDFITNKRLQNKGFFSQKISGINPDDRIFDISSPTQINEVQLIIDENNTGFIIDSMQNHLKMYLKYNPKNVKVINSEFRIVKNQNLHSIDKVDMIIVTPSILFNQANELKQIHEQEGLRVCVVTDEEVYNEFSSGVMDPTAIKQFARNVYKKQVDNPSNRLRYLLLFGDGSFDYKNRIKNNNNIIPTFQFEESEEFLNAMVSDDYFGMMDDNESLKGTDLLDIAVGRMLISTEEQAESMINKIKAYMSYSKEKTDWRSKIAMIVDDEEGGYFINNDAEVQANYLKLNHPEINVSKLYADAFQQVSTAGGERFPTLNKAIDDHFFNGALVVSYVGHGGPSGAGEERFLSISQVANYTNISKMPLFMSSTCEFTKYDDPTRVSAGEVMFLNPKGGAIALMTTTRPVFFGVNTISGNTFYKNVLQIDSITNETLTFGEIFRRTKNNSGTSSNRRSFTLIGDPALKINYPNNKVVIDSINGKLLKDNLDTLKALSKVKISGHVENRKGNSIDKNGTVFISIYDKIKESSTLGQNVESPIIKFENQNSLLFKGVATVTNSKFNIEFVLPKDLDFKIGKGKVSIISYQDNEVGIGFTDSILLGGIDNVTQKDSIGPSISLSLDSLKEVENGIFRNNPILYIKLKDESGLNISSTGIGHQVSLVVNDNVNNTYDLNSFYVSDPDTYKSGKITFPLSNLEIGKHKLKVKAWDVYNNSSEKELSFTISGDEQGSLHRIFNYPNPFTSKTDFYIEQSGDLSNVNIKLEIFTISGKVVKEVILDKINLRSSIEKIFEWNGEDQFGDKLSKGVYIYRITTLGDKKDNVTKMEKLVIF